MSTTWKGRIELLLEANNRFVNGDPEPYKELWHRGDKDITIALFSGNGEVLSGWEALCEHFDSVAADCRDWDGVFEHTVLVESVTEDAACVARLQHAYDRLSDAVVDRRVTLFYRVIDGDWKIVYQHVDPYTTQP
ncbi:nuclear transport factor 2 family protein [Streptomyces goshikiensis]|uniref:nuclear transport factor 2 family protein n=1 Tax=Streptomyces goshikiensis TaxID=1942 RepID=UPI00367F31D2